jgi:ribosomal protein L16 Arg81 hydroxylase
MPRVTPDGALHAVLAPLSVDAFLEHHWERAPLHVARDVPGYFADLYDVADIEESLVVGARDLERFAIVKAGGIQAALDDYVVTSPAIRGKSTGKPATTHVDPRKVIGLFERGYTLVIKDAGLLSGRLQRWCNRLQGDLCAYAGANVYFTPPGAQGFDVHHDSHDTLTVQIEGNKTWRIYEPVVELPLESQPLHRETAMPALRLQREVDVAAGDTLYLPRGYAHEAVAAAGRSLHVTFALAPVRAIDLLHAALDAAAAADVNLRRALPFGWQDDPHFAAAFAAQIAPRLAATFDRDAVAAATDSTLGDLFAASRNDAGTAFDQLNGIDALAPDSVLRFNDRVPSVLRERATTVDVFLPGKSLGFPKLCRAALEQLRTGPVRFSELALPLPDADRRLFVKTLILEGLMLVDER